MNRIQRALIAGNVAKNVTPSVPVGFYLREERAPCIGDVVSFLAADVVDLALVEHLISDAGPLHEWSALFGASPAKVKLLKRVVAMAGDEIEVEGEIVSVNSEVVAHRRFLPEPPPEAPEMHRRLWRRASHGMPMWSGRRLLQAGELFVLSDGDPARWVLDSRYFGPLDARHILGVWSLLSDDEVAEINALGRKLWVAACETVQTKTPRSVAAARRSVSRLVRMP